MVGDVSIAGTYQRSRHRVFPGNEIGFVPEFLETFRRVDRRIETVRVALHVPL